MSTAIQTGLGEATPVSSEQVRGKIKSFVSDLKASKTTSGKRTISGWASKPTIDRVREVVDAGAFADTLDIYKENPILLYMHDLDQPIGTVTTMTLSPEGLYVECEIAKNTQTGDEVWSLIEQGVLRAFSIGFRELDGSPDENNVWHITKLELLEVSVVSVPACRQAIFSMSGGKCIKVELLPETVEQASDDQLVAEAERRGLSVIRPESRKDTPMIGFVKKEDRTIQTGTCSGCGTEGEIMPLVTWADQTLSVCENCLGFKKPAPVEAKSEAVAEDTAVETVTTEKDSVINDLSERVADLEKAVIALTKREVNRLAAQMGVAGEQ